MSFRFRTYGQRVADGQRLAAHNAQPVHVVAIEHASGVSSQVLRVLDYGVMSRQKARNLTNKLQGRISSTYMGAESYEYSMTSEKGYLSYGVPIVKVEKFNPNTGYPVE